MSFPIIRSDISRSSSLLVYLNNQKTACHCTIPYTATAETVSPIPMEHPPSSVPPSHQGQRLPVEDRSATTTQQTHPENFRVLPPSDDIRQDIGDRSPLIDPILKTSQQNQNQTSPSSWLPNPKAPSHISKQSPNIDLAINTRKLPQLPGFEQEDDYDNTAKMQGYGYGQEQGRGSGMAGHGQGQQYGQDGYDGNRKGYHPGVSGASSTALGMYEVTPESRAVSGGHMPVQGGPQPGMGMVGMVQSYLDHGRGNVPNVAGTNQQSAQDYRYGANHEYAGAYPPYYPNQNYGAPPHSASATTSHYSIPQTSPSTLPHTGYPYPYTTGYNNTPSRYPSESGTPSFPNYPINAYPTQAYYPQHQQMTPGAPQSAPPHSSSHGYGAQSSSSAMAPYYPVIQGNAAVPAQTSSGSNSPPASTPVFKRKAKKRKSTGGEGEAESEELDDRPVGEAGTFVACTKWYVQSRGSMSMCANIGFRVTL